MTVDYHYHINRRRIPVLSPRTTVSLLSITINTTILSVTTRLLFVHFFIYMCIYFIFLYNLQRF